MSVHFGHCVDCKQPIRPPFMSFAVRKTVGDGNTVWEWGEIDICDDCAGTLTVAGLHRLVCDEDEAA